MIQVKDRQFELYISHETIAEKVALLGERISRDYVGKDPIFIPVLNGAFMFAADLLKHVNVDCEVSFIKVASYEGMESTGAVEEILGLEADIHDRHIILVEDIVDTGLTLHEIIKSIAVFQPASISVAAFFLKPASIVKELPLGYIGMEIPNDFIVGYGLDYMGYGRNLRDVYKVVAEPTSVS
jgi:hypoxanthine phosphoribosyltransferase